jgi:hypothetical protein
MDHLATHRSIVVLLVCLALLSCLAGALVGAQAA